MSDPTARLPDVAGHAALPGYVHTTRDLLDAADVVLVPSCTAPFGDNAVGDLPARRADAVRRSSTDRYAEALRPEFDGAAHRAPAEGSPARWIAPCAGLDRVVPVPRR